MKARLFSLFILLTCMLIQAQEQAQAQTKAQAQAQPQQSFPYPALPIHFAAWSSVQAI